MLATAVQQPLTPVGRFQIGQRYRVQVCRRFPTGTPYFRVYPHVNHDGVPLPYGVYDSLGSGEFNKCFQRTN